jgi:hypothetical protein
MGQCPSGFVPYNGACVKECPNNFQFLTGNNQPRCAYTGDPTKSVLLTPVPAVVPEPGKPLPTLEEMKTKDPGRYARFNGEMDRFNSELAILMKTIDKRIQVDNAFKALQAAEDARDQAPEAYQMARTAYYTLTKGPEWVDEEKKRIAAAEVDPELQRYRTALKDAQERTNVQQRTQDVMRSVKDGVLSLKDDVQYTTKTFQDQIDKLKNQINIERRGREKAVGEETPFYKWIDAVLNVLIVIGLLFAAYTLWTKLSKPRTTTVYAPVATIRQ